MSYRRVVSRLVLVGGLLLLAAVPVLAAISYDLSWWTVDGGGGAVSGGSYALTGTIGQPDAGVLTGGGYTLGGGFWGGGAAAVEYKVYLPLVLRQYP
jgi:hypothetical protein